MDLPEDQRLKDISPKAYEHPADRAATAALQQIPMMDTVVRKLIEFGERSIHQQLLAGAVRLGPDQLPEIWASHRAALARLDIEYVPDLYMWQMPFTNAMAIGSKKPMVVLNSGTVSLLEWYRAAELTCDRAATLVNRSPMTTCQTMMVMAGGAASRKLSLDAFVKQANEYVEWEPGWYKLMRFTRELSMTHPYPVLRVSELMKWVRSGEYD